MEGMKLRPQVKIALNFVAVLLALSVGLAVAYGLYNLGKRVSVLEAVDVQQVVTPTVQPTASPSATMTPAVLQRPVVTVVPR